jgi:DNA-directed RNA polymerase subunit L
MKLEVIEQKKNALVLEFKDEDRTLVDLLRKELWNDEEVKAAGLYESHPLVGTPRLILETKGEPPKEALLAASNRLKKIMTKLSKEIEKEIS